MTQRLRQIFHNSWSLLRLLLAVFLLTYCLYSISSLESLYISEPMQPLIKHSSAISSTETTTNKKIRVSITGAVKSPGVYELAEPAFAQNLIDAAGGFTNKADLVTVYREINLAKALAEEQQIYIPTQSEQKSPVATNLQTAIPNLININTATLAQLDTLPGVGVSMAEKIIAARPFAVIDDLKNVSGIGDATFDKLAGLITV